MFDIVSIDEVCRRAVTLPAARRFVCLTFDGGYKDLMTSAYPVLARHGVPFTAAHAGSMFSKLIVGGIS